MAEYNINKIKLPNGDIVKLVDETSGYVKSSGVTSVGLQNATNGGLSVSGSPVTGSGTISVGHSNVLTSAQTTQALYPIAIDKNGHISSYGTAVDPEDIYYITYTYTTGASDAEMINRTPAEVASAYRAGKYLIFKHIDGDGIPTYFQLVTKYLGDNNVAVYEFSFTNAGVSYYDSSIYSFTENITLTENGSSFNLSLTSSANAPSSHAHGNITTDGKISSTAVTPANGDYILISDSSGSDKIERGIKIGTGTTKYLREDGTWQTVSTSDTKVKMTSTTSGSEYPIILGPTSITSGNDYEAYYNSSVTINADYQRITAKRLRINYDINSSFTINQGSYQGTTSNNTPVVKFTSLKANASGGTDKNVMISGITTPIDTGSSYDNYAASKKYVDDRVGVIIRTWS